MEGGAPQDPHRVPPHHELAGQHLQQARLACAGRQAGREADQGWAGRKQAGAEPGRRRRRYFSWSTKARCVIPAPHQIHWLLSAGSGSQVVAPG